MKFRNSRRWRKFWKKVFILLLNSCSGKIWIILMWQISWILLNECSDVAIACITIVPIAIIRLATAVGTVILHPMVSVICWFGEQCDQMVRLLFNIWPFAKVKFCKVRLKSCKSRFNILPKTEKPSRIP